MKKVKLCAVIFSLTAMLCGCTKTIDLTEKETDMLAEYISKEVLERDKCYEQGLITPELVSDKDDDRDNDVVQPVEQEDKSEQNQIVTPSKKPEVTNKPEEITAPEEKEDKAYTLNDVLGTNKINVTFKSKKVYSSYPEKENNYFVINANDGYKLLVVTFNLENTSDKKINYSMLKQSIDYTLVMENGSAYSPLLTLLENDLKFIEKTIKGHGKETGVLVFRVKKADAKLAGTLTVENGTEDSTNKKCIKIELE